MPITAANVRELMLRGESQALDFKREHYTDNSELAKDIMSLANCLLRTSEPAYILIGVDEDEHGRGVLATDAPSHPDDAELQGKVDPLLNPHVNFAFYVVNVDGFPVGVVEVRHSGRPIAALRDGRSLKAGLAYVRHGTRNGTATAHEIVKWAREDHLLDNEAALLAVDELRMRVVPVVRAVGGGFSLQHDQLVGNFKLQNQGRVNVTVDKIDASWWFVDELRGHTGHPFARAEPGPHPMQERRVTALGGMLQPNQVTDVVLHSFMPSEAMQALQKAYDLYRTTPLLRIDARITCTAVGTRHEVIVEHSFVLVNEAQLPAR